jgi:hypothetical protein
MIEVAEQTAIGLFLMEELKFFAATFAEDAGLSWEEFLKTWEGYALPYYMTVTEVTAKNLRRHVMAAYHSESLWLTDN